MELFSEIYSCYYQVLRHLLCSADPLTIQDIRSRICGEGFEESLLSIIPKLEDGTWNLFEKEGKLYRSRISSTFITPVSGLEKAYLKALLSDPRMGLFLDGGQRDALDQMLEGVTPLWKPGQFYYFDRFSDSDPYEDENYRRCFRTLLRAQKENRFVDIDYTSPNGSRVHHHYVPARLEYSVKNDKFRLLCLRPSRSGDHSHGQWRRNRIPDTGFTKNAETTDPGLDPNGLYPNTQSLLRENTPPAISPASCCPEQTGGKMRLEILNVSRIQNVLPMDKILSSPADLNTVIRRSYYQEPLRLRIVDRRNALERAMLHFANYEKNTTKIDDDTYECLIYYNQGMETELLIEVMSFGPMLTVLGNERFLSSLKARLQRQRKLAAEMVSAQSIQTEQ